MVQQTVKMRDFRNALKIVPDDADLTFGTSGTLRFLRVIKKRANLFAIEFDTGAVRPLMSAKS